MKVRGSTFKILPIIFIFGIFGLVFAGGFLPQKAAASTITKNLVSNLGLVGYWPMDDATGTIAHDFSGNKNNGTLTNMANPATATSGWGNGKLGKALNFDGTDDYLDAGTHSSINSLNTISVGFWFKSTQVWNAIYWPGSATFVTKGTSGACSNDWTIVAGSKNAGVNEGRVIVGEGCVSSNDNLVYSNTGKNDGKWHFVLWKRVPGLSSLYVDGVLEDSHADDSSNIAASRSIQIGYDQFLGGSKLAGTIDDVRIYNRALSATEVASLYKTGAAKIMPTTDSNAPLRNGLVGYWTMDKLDISGTALYDRSGSGNIGTLVAGPTSVPGKIGQALNFNGSSSYVHENTSFNNTPSSMLTTCSWIKTSSSISSLIWQISRNGSNYTNEGGLSLTTNGHTLFWDYGSSGYGFDSASSPSNTMVADGLWHHVCFVKNNTAGTYYTDGKKDGTVTAAASVSYGSTDFAIGIDYRCFQLSGINCFFSGSLDDVRIYNRALSASEVSQLYKIGATKYQSTSVAQGVGTSLTSGLVGYWTFDNKDLAWTSATAGTALDRSGSGNTGTLTNMSRTASPVIGKLGQALKFNGTNQYVDAGTGSSLNPSAVTVSAWIKPSAFPYAYNPIYSKRNANSAYYLIAVRSTGKLALYTLTGTNTDVSYDATGIFTLNTGRWYHVVLTYSSSTGLTGYVNGVLDKNVAANGNALVSNSGAANIGYDTQTGTFFSGSIDDVRIYNRALSAAEVTQLYNMGK